MKFAVPTHGCAHLEDIRAAPSGAPAQERVAGACREAREHAAPSRRQAESQPWRTPCVLGDSMAALFFPTRCVKFEIAATKEVVRDAFISRRGGRLWQRREKNASQALNFMHRALFSGSSSLDCRLTNSTVSRTGHPACARWNVRLSRPACPSGPQNDANERVCSGRLSSP